MVTNPYTDALKEELDSIDNANPFAEDTPSENTNDKQSGEVIYTEKKPIYEKRQKSNNYFNLILDSDLQDIELEIRGIRKVGYYDEKMKKNVEEYEKKENHYLTDNGADFLLTQLKLHIPADMKLGYITADEFKTTMSAFHEELFDFVQDHMNVLGMYSFEDQNKGLMLCIAIVNRVRAVYSRSIGGNENKRSHGDIHLSGNLEGDREAKYSLEDSRN